MITQKTNTKPRILNGLGDFMSLGSDTNNSSQLKLDPRTYDRSLDCVHCGLCLPACPPYTQNGLEADSPRGRIILMRGLADGRIDPSETVVKHLDLCLDCRACETACPSGVVYHEIVEESREKLVHLRPKSLVDKMLGLVFYHVFPYPLRLKIVMLPARISQKIGLWQLFRRSPLTKFLPPQLDKMQQMLPEKGPLWESKLAKRYPANAPDGKKRATVGFFAGCVGNVLYQDVNRDSIALLQHAGCDVIVPNSQTCCAAIHYHGGKTKTATKMAVTNINAFLDATENVDYIVNNIAGCGAMLHDYPHLLRDNEKHLGRAKQFKEKLRDISEILLDLEMTEPEYPVNETITYHDACHLAHAQGVKDPPRELLNRVQGLTVKPLPEADICCGAAGTYNLSQPKMAVDLAERKINNIKSTGATICAMGNVGCAMQIQSEADRMGVDIKVVHPVNILRQAYLGSD